MRDITLDHHLRASSGQVLATGLQALVRLPLEQAHIDRARGLNTAGFISGYRGSPLGLYDMDLLAAREFTGPANIVVQPAINEEMAATALWGTQQVNLMPGAKHDGVFGIWYGKAPGIDRALDPMRHANFAGTSPKGGVVVLVGDDPECKSSTLPSQSEYALVHAEIPILNPSDVQEVLDFGVTGFALSRYCGCWVALMATSDNMESHAVIDVGVDRYTHLPAREETDTSVHIRHSDTALAQEARLRGLKLPAAVEFARRAKLNRRMIDGPKRRLGIIATGRAYGELLQALKDLGLDHAQAAELGLSVLKIDLLWPLDNETVREFAAGLEDVLVVEDKRPLLEGLVKTALYDLPGDRRPRVIGKRDSEGKLLLPDTGIVTESDIAKALLDRLPANVVSFADAKFKLRATTTPARESRSPFFCSGCPHNRSTRVIPGSGALAGIGCHYLVRFRDNAETDFFSQMGGEGVQWVGQAPFTTTPHMFANLGDGTYVHSGILAIRQAIAAKTRITYKILFNGAVAMTGGQPVDTGLDVATLTRQLAAEGVARIAVVAEDPGRHNGGKDFAPGVTLHPRTALSAVEHDFRDIDGVTAIIYDQMCATEKRRMRKRGLLEDPPLRPFINELVCEGCGDCSVKSNCISVEPAETEFGRKRRINQSSCNKDFSCVEGFCPSFVTVHGGQRRTLDINALLTDPLPAPARASLDRAHNTLISGIGGLGVTTLAGILSMAAHLEGRGVRTLNQPGLAQKGGAVSSHVRIARGIDELATPSVPLGEADLHLAYDMIVGGGTAARTRMSASRTSTLINHALHPTSGFVHNTDKTYDAQGLEKDICASSRAMETIDASTLSETLMGSELFGGMIMLGYALQKGWLPVSLEAVTRAIVLNGAAETQNLKALDLGRLVAIAPEKVAAFITGFQKPLSPAPTRDLDTMIAERKRYLEAYQNPAYAARYTALVASVQAVEEAQAPGGRALTETVARAAFAAMVIKDEYEVARLLTLPEFRDQLNANFSGDYAIAYHLAPSWLTRKDKTTGEPRKLKIGQWLTPVLKFAARLKGLRETPLDLFSFDPLRRKERELRDAYFVTVQKLIDRLTPANHARAVEIAALPLEVRGYGHIKKSAIAKMERRQEELWRKFLAADSAPASPERVTRAG
jgi:indolepyruvate ferredoxin oxidoreductase